MTTLAERLLSEDEFLALPEDPEGRKLELLDGRVVCMSQPGEEHSIVGNNIYDAIKEFVRPKRLGQVRVDVGFKLRSAPDRIVNPDVAFVAADRLDPARDRTKAIPGAPSLAVEVVSPTDRDADVAGKVLEYIAAGTARVWVVRPTSQTVTVHRPDSTARTYHAGEALGSDEAGLAAEGFSLPVGSIFELD
jgi:Uma2 family endonuclease